MNSSFLRKFRIINGSETDNNLCCHSQETEPETCDDYETGNMDVLADMDIRDLSNDFSNTFMLDEEIELEHKMLKKTELSSTKRMVILNKDIGVVTENQNPFPMILLLQ